MYCSSGCNDPFEVMRDRIREAIAANGGDERKRKWSGDDGDDDDDDEEGDDVNSCVRRSISEAVQGEITACMQTKIPGWEGMPAVTQKRKGGRGGGARGGGKSASKSGRKGRGRKSKGGNRKFGSRMRGEGAKFHKMFM